jgi:hypothetical protein
MSVSDVKKVRGTRRSRKTKRVLRFYFAADTLNSLFDRLMLKLALDVDSDEKSMERLIVLDDEKCCLAEFWRYLNRAMVEFSHEDLMFLEEYAMLRSGMAFNDDLQRKRLKRLLMRFTRRTPYLSAHGRALEMLDRYHCFY